ncbi:NAD-dependent dehydratase [Bacillaceae bacterium SAOS 7]|nr:NAD-dependent dehydratase [Bacillaceae bacterium SAOS 7]
MKKVLVAGATGYLGRYVVQELHKQGYYVKALVRNEQKLAVQGNYMDPAIHDIVDEVVQGELTNRASLEGICEDIDIVFSSVGITRQKDGLTFMDVDYQGNVNLLREAERSGVKTFMYIHVFGDYIDAPVVKAKKRFVEQLKQSTIDHIIMKPTGYFSDMTEFLQMAKKGKVYLIGDGTTKMNPIHGSDLAKCCVDSIEKRNEEVSVGGPSAPTYEQMAQMALLAAGKEGKVVHIPQWIVNVVLGLLKVVSKRHYELAQFFVNGARQDLVAPPYGEQDLEGFYQECMKKENRR